MRWVSEHAVHPTLASIFVRTTPAFPGVSAVFADACLFLLLARLLLAGCGRDVMEALAERELGYCQHLPPEERTFYLLAAGHSKVRTAAVAGVGSCSCLGTYVSVFGSNTIPVSSCFRRFELPLSCPFLSHRSEDQLAGRLPRPVVISKQRCMDHTMLHIVSLDRALCTC